MFFKNRYDIIKLRRIVGSLRQYIARKPEIFYELDSHKMEDLVRSVFSDFLLVAQLKHFEKHEMVEKMD